MRRHLTLASLLLVGLLAAASPTTIYPTTVIVRLVDPVERWLFSEGVKPELFYFSFKTVYKINGEVVEPGDWWRAVKRGMTLEVKATKREDFWFAAAANLRTGRTK